jgi:hypothetical protein
LARARLEAARALVVRTSLDLITAWLLRAQCDKMALHHGKRCILWDDDASGFYLWMHWDWAANRPAKVDPDDKRRRVRSVRPRVVRCAPGLT